MAAPAFAISFFCYIATLLTLPPLPLRVNRQTGELYYMQHRLYKASWLGLEARTAFMPRMVATGATTWFILHSDGIRKPLAIAGGGGRSWERALRHWECFCMYMESGTPVSILREVTEAQKSQIRKNRETPMGSLLTRHANLTSPNTWLYCEALPSPQSMAEEVIAMCQKHPNLQTPEGRASMKDREQCGNCYTQ